MGTPAHVNGREMEVDPMKAPGPMGLFWLAMATAKPESKSIILMPRYHCYSYFTTC